MPTVDELQAQINALTAAIHARQPTWVSTTAAPAPAPAAPPDPWAGIPSANDCIWLILCGALVMFMQAGFAMLEAGVVRLKNVQNILMKNLMDVCCGCMGWWAFGWAFAYGGPFDDKGATKNRFIGGRQFFGSGFMKTLNDGQQVPDEAKQLSWFFQWAFCSAASTIVSGGVAERVNFPGYLVYSIFMTSFIYPVCVCWTWGYGFLYDKVNDTGYMDFAGSGIVHMVGGVGALVGAAVSGARKGRWEDPELFEAHNMPLVVLGTFILWFGWYGFNCGSTLGLSDSKTGLLAAQVAMNTTIAASIGGITVFSIKFALGRKYEIGSLCNGILAGLVSITAGCGNVECGTAWAIGLLGGFVYVGASKGLQLLKVDDPLDAFAVHGACGAWGVLPAAFFDWGKGFDFAHGWSGFDCVSKNGACAPGAGGEIIAANIVEVVAISSWVAILSLAIFVPLRMAGLLVAADDLQEMGMDAAKHSPTKAYGGKDTQ